MRTIAIMLMLAVGTPAAAQVRSGATGPVRYYSPLEYQMMYRYRLQHLRAELLKQQRADGGTLSQASLVRYQARLDELNAGFAKSMRNHNPLSLDAMGSAVASAK